MTSEMEGIEPTSTTQSQKPKSQKFEIRTFTIRTSPFGYAQLQLMSSPPQETQDLDALQVRSYCSSALSRYLGYMGKAVTVDVLKVQGSQCWVRVRQPDLAAFAAAISAWPGTSDRGLVVKLKILQCSDWLGSMVGRESQEELWNSK
jgi:ribonuclease P/MRP protein subunit POP8